jgi:guanyl-specific ribonuclease Sa
LPDECSDGYNNCDWTRFGVGASKNDPPAEDKTTTTGTTWCCSDDSIDLGLCDETEKGHLLVNPILFQGYHRISHIPASGNPSIQHGSLKNLKYGNYVVLTANCDQHGRAIQVTGALDWSQNELSVTNSTAAPTSSDTTSRQNADDDDDNVFKEEHLPSFGRKVLNIVVAGGVSFLVVGSLIIIYRNREMARWQEYRTHQLLQAQDEAFDLTTEEAFDLELVEATPGMKMNSP